MQTADVLDAMGGLVAQLKIYAAKLPPVVHLSAVPSGVKPRLEAIEEYEDIVSRFRGQSAGTSYKGLNELFVESLEASAPACCWWACRGWRARATGGRCNSRC